MSTAVPKKQQQIIKRLQSGSLDRSQYHEILCEAAEKGWAAVLSASLACREEPQEGLDHLLHFATAWGRDYHDAIEVLLSAGANPNAPQVLDRCHVASLPLLIQHGGDVDQGGSGQPLFHSIIERTKQNKSLALIEVGADVNVADENGVTAVMHAAALGRNKTFDAMVRRGADLYAVDNTGRSVARHVAESLTGGTHISTDSDRKNAVRLARQLIQMLPAQPEDQVLLTLVIDDVNGLRKMLRAGLDPNTMIAGGIGWIGTAEHDEVWKLLRANFKSVEPIEEKTAIPTEEEQDRIMDGMTLLIWATAMRRIDIIKMLLEHGADPRQQNQGGVSAIYIAERRRTTESILGLLKGHGEASQAEATGEPLRCHHLRRAESEIKSLLDSAMTRFEGYPKQFQGPSHKYVIEKQWQIAGLNYLLNRDDRCRESLIMILEWAEEMFFGPHFQESESASREHRRTINWVRPYTIALAAGAALGRWDEVGRIMTYPDATCYRGERSPSDYPEWYEWPLWLHIASGARGDIPDSKWLEGMKQNSTRKSKAMLAAFNAIEAGKARQAQTAIVRIVEVKVAWEKSLNRGIRPERCLSAEATYFYNQARHQSLQIELQDERRPVILELELV